MSHEPAVRSDWTGPDIVDWVKQMRAPQRQKVATPGPPTVELVAPKPDQPPRRLRIGVLAAIAAVLALGLLAGGCTSISAPTVDHPGMALQGGLPGIGVARGGAVQLTSTIAATAGHNWLIDPPDSVRATTRDTMAHTDMAFFRHVGTPAPIGTPAVGQAVDVACNRALAADFILNAVGFPTWEIAQRSERRARVVGYRAVIWADGSSAELIFLADGPGDPVATGCSGGAVTSADGALLGMLVGRLTDAFDVTASASAPAQSFPAGTHIAYNVRQLRAEYERLVAAGFLAAN